MASRFAANCGLWLIPERWRERRFQTTPVPDEPCAPLTELRRFRHGAGAHRSHCPASPAMVFGTTAHPSAVIAGVRQGSADPKPWAVIPGSRAPSAARHTTGALSTCLAVSDPVPQIIASLPFAHVAAGKLASQLV